MIVEIAGRFASGSPVTAVTVTPHEMSVPELVMKALEPLITHSPSFNRALVWLAPASVPDCGSVRPKAHSFLPAQRSGR